MPSDRALKIEWTITGAGSRSLMQIDVTNCDTEIGKHRESKGTTRNSKTRFFKGLCRKLLKENGFDRFPSLRRGFDSFTRSKAIHARVPALPIPRHSMGRSLRTLRHVRAHQRDRACRCNIPSSRSDDEHEVQTLGCGCCRSAIASAQGDPNGVQIVKSAGAMIRWSYTHGNQAP